MKINLGRMPTMKSPEDFGGYDEYCRTCDRDIAEEIADNQYERGTTEWESFLDNLLYTEFGECKQCHQLNYE